MEDKLKKWFYQYHEVEGHKVKASDIKRKALDFSNDSTFRASKGWLQKFKYRYNIKLN